MGDISAGSGKLDMKVASEARSMEDTEEVSDADGGSDTGDASDVKGKLDIRDASDIPGEVDTGDASDITDACRSSSGTFLWYLSAFSVLGPSEQDVVSREAGVHGSSEVDWVSPPGDVWLGQAPSGLSGEKEASEVQVFSSGCSSGSPCSSMSTAIPSLGNWPSEDADPAFILGVLVSSAVSGS